MVLIVEDNAHARELFARIVSGLGHEVLESEDGTDALRLLDMHEVDLVITDLRMPKMDGFSLISHVRLKWPRLPIVLVSGYVSPDDVSKNRDEFLEISPKPVDRGHLIATVNRFVPAS